MLSYVALPLFYTGVGMVLVWFCIDKYRNTYEHNPKNGSEAAAGYSISYQR